MSNKGMNQSLQTRQKLSVENTKDRTILLEKIQEYILQLKTTDFPSITACAIYSHINEKTLLSFEMRSPENSEVRSLLEDIRDLQKQTLMHKGLSKIYDSNLAKLLLKAHHGLKEEPTTLTQNNTFNVSPEILAEAIEISRKPKK